MTFVSMRPVEPRRGARRRGVSPIIASILLVAIVVVLAAVLYLVVIRLSESTDSSRPLGSALYLGPARAESGTVPTNPFCQTNHYCYSVAVTATQSGITMGDLEFRILTSGGTIHTVAQNFAKLSIVGVQGSQLAYTQISKNSPFVVTAWGHLSSGTSPNSMVSSGMQLWIQFGNTKMSPFGHGYTMQVIGRGAYDGTLTVVLP
ncbi:MAG TPA: archaellin/type IV pilin N-terminal domain-containing protein [Thermoplasmata archaeon]|nr:archaellin/type IV pilin N-terminal domain-containing protein [Thermoplasmata archaeon]